MYIKSMHEHEHVHVCKCASVHACVYLCVFVCMRAGVHVCVSEYISSLSGVSSSHSAPLQVIAREGISSPAAGPHM